MESGILDRRPGHHSLWARDPSDPTGEARKTVFLEVEQETRLRTAGHQSMAKWRLLFALQEALVSAERIYRTIRRTDVSTIKDGLCYVARPLFIRDEHGVTIQRPLDMVYCAYVSPRDVVYDWRLDPCDGADPASPSGWQERFGELIWTAKGR